MTETLYTADEVATRLKLHPKTVRRFVREGKLRAVRIGTGPKAALRIPASAVREFLTLGRVKEATP